MPNITVANRDNQSFQVKQGRTVLTGAKDSDVRWRSYCGGQALCGTCCMLVVDGQLDEPSEIERYFIEGWGYHPSYRLACQARVTQDATVISCADAGFEKDAVLAAYEAARK